MTNTLERTIICWLQELEHYSNEQLLLKPSAAAWSMGQLYMHLIISTDYFIDQAIICAETNQHSDEISSPAAKTMFQNNAFPDLIIEGPESNNHTPQPGTKEQIVNELNQLNEKIKKAMAIITTSSNKGKTKHPGLQYFNAAEWIQFAEMHLRHHMRQKERLDAFLSSV